MRPFKNDKDYISSLQFKTNKEDKEKSKVQFVRFLFVTGKVSIYLSVMLLLPFYLLYLFVGNDFDEYYIIGIVASVILGFFTHQISRIFVFVLIKFPLWKVHGKKTYWYELNIDFSNIEDVLLGFFIVVGNIVLFIFLQPYINNWPGFLQVAYAIIFLALIKTGLAISDGD